MHNVYISIISALYNIERPAEHLAMFLLCNEGDV